MRATNGDNLYCGQVFEHAIILPAVGLLIRIYRRGRFAQDVEI